MRDDEADHRNAIAVPELPMEEAFAACLKEDDMELDEAQFALFMNTMYASDAYSGIISGKRHSMNS